METRASYVAVGAFVLAAIAGIVISIIWIGKFQAQQEFARYDILFEDSVSGLQLDGVVRYRGIPVGRIIDIRIDPDNIEFIRVTVELERETPIRTDTVATSELQGITGLSYVQLSGGLQTSPALEQTMKEPYPRIKAERSALTKVFEGVPDLINRATNLIDRATQILDPENEQAVANILKNLEGFTGSLTDEAAGVGGLLQTGKDAAAQIGRTAAAIEQLANDIRGELMNMGKEGEPTVADLIAGGTEATKNISTMSAEFQSLAQDLRKEVGQLSDDAGSTLASFQGTAVEIQGTAKSLAAVADQLSAVIGENREGLRDFGNNGLYELTLFVTEARLLVASLSRISAQIERDPARFFLGDRRQGFEAEQ